TRSYGDWSSDVCSSDLSGVGELGAGFLELLRCKRALVDEEVREPISPIGKELLELLRALHFAVDLEEDDRLRAREDLALERVGQIGRASCRESVARACV